MDDMIHFGNDWDQVLQGEFEKDYYVKLRAFLKDEYATQTVYPSMYDIFNAFKTTPYAETRVVIIGQDPYYRPGQAHGMCFSVRPGTALPPSLKNIYKEISDDIGVQMSLNGYLKPWAEQGVLLLNTVLTVRENQPLSHKGKGWETFTDNVLKKLNEREDPIIFLLWGTPAKNKAQVITKPAHIKLTAAHPSPLSAHYGFFGCKHFSKTNDLLRSMGKEPIDWKL